MRRTVRYLAALAVAATAAACTSTTAAPTASELCRTANIGRVASASASTVGAIRSITHNLAGQAPRPMWPDALSPARPAAAAAWCWVQRGRYDYVAYVVADGVPPDEIGTVNGETSTPVGVYPVF